MPPLCSHGGHLVSREMGSSFYLCFLEGMGQSGGGGFLPLPAVNGHCHCHPLLVTLCGRGAGEGPQGPCRWWWLFHRPLESREGRAVAGRLPGILGRPAVSLSTAGTTWLEARVTGRKMFSGQLVI